MELGVFFIAEWAVFFFMVNPLLLKVTQPMVFTEGPRKGQAKGLKQVCLERFGEAAIQGKKHDDFLNMLRDEPDFRLVKLSLYD